MKPIVVNMYLLFMFLAHVMRRAGTISMEEKVRMIEFLGYMAANPDTKIMGHGDAETLSRGEKRSQSSRVVHLEAPSQASKSPEHNPRL